MEGRGREGGRGKCNNNNNNNNNNNSNSNNNNNNNNNTQITTIALPPLTTHPQLWAKLLTFIPNYTTRS